MVKENNNDESDFSENEIPERNFLKPFTFAPKTNIGDIMSTVIAVIMKKKMLNI